jgi:hypothetical protein
MNREEVYQEWIRQHKEIHLSKGFTEDVMSRVHRLEPERDKSPFEWSRIVDWVGYSPWARAAAVTMAALLGFGRILLTLRLLLFA